MPLVNYLYFTYCFGVGFAASCVDCLSVVILPEFFDKHLGLATGIRLSSIVAASILFNFMAPIFVVEIGWQKLFYCFSSVGLLLIMYSFLFRIKHPVHDVPSNEVEAKETYSVCGENLTINERILHDRGFQLIVFGCPIFVCNFGASNVCGTCIYFSAECKKFSGMKKISLGVVSQNETARLSN